MHKLGAKIVRDEVVDHVTQVRVYTQGSLTHGAVDDAGLDRTVCIRPSHSYRVIAHGGHAGLGYGRVPHTDGFFLLSPGIVRLGHVLAGHASQTLAVDAQQLDADIAEALVNQSIHLRARGEDILHLLEIGGNERQTLHLKDWIICRVNELQGQVDGAVHQTLNDNVLRAQGVGVVHLHGDGTVSALLDEVREAQGCLRGNMLLGLGGRHF